MIRKLALVLITLLVACHHEAQPTGSAYERARSAAANGKMRDAVKLFTEAAQSDPDPEHRAEAPVRLANIEWRVLGDVNAARTRLRKLDTSAAHAELARLGIETKEFASSRDEAKKALATAKKKKERRRATLLLAGATVADPAATPESLRASVTTLRALIAEAGPVLEVARLLTRAALRAGDGAAALEGVDAYYHVSAYATAPQLVAAGRATLARLLPPWRGSDAERPAIAAALAEVRFFDEAALVQPRGAIADYAAALRRIDADATAYYRALSTDGAKEKTLRAIIDREKPAQEFGKRYGIYVLLGTTGGYFDLHLGHRVIDRAMPVEQYGHKAAVNFVALDSMVSNGFSEWCNDGTSGDGGWGTAKEIVQVRPRYANGPLREWELVADAEVRGEDERETAQETERDRARAKEQPIQFFPGLAKRLRRQYLESVYRETRERDAFIARVEREHFTSSILLHEGRHAIDASEKRMGKVWTREYRAKLAEISLAPSPREALGSVVDNDIGGTGSHSEANGHLAEGLVQWMEQHRAEIHGLDATLPLFPQIDRLTDEQIRTAVRSLDELATNG
ncbi:MAG TPA: hypothetical protein VF824_03995 [Thermoanaerobaculia bacterium]